MPEFTLVIGDKNTSSWSLRPWLLLRMAGIEFEELPVRLRLPDSKQNIVRHSPAGHVPVLKHNGLVIWDSLAIAEYVAEQFPEKQLWPADKAARAMARSISAEMHSGFAPLRIHMPMDMLGSHPGQDLDKEGVASDIARVQEIWRDARAQFGAGGPFLFGAFSIADAMYAPVVSRFRTYGVVCDAACSAYMEAVWNLPAMQLWIEGARQQPAPPKIP
ncbi:MAG: glutathione S-transferase family protein [Alphaproteobacteria bacterium]|nr:glutathione S-transferase family protein [Alphaproteobacteria bacterium]